MSEIDEIEQKELFDEMAQEEELTKLLQNPNRVIKMHCKPCSDFQTIEFDYVVSNDDDIKDMMQLFNKIYLELIQVSVDKKPFEPPASAKQKEIMDKFGIKYNKYTTAKEAQKLIQDSIDKANK